MKGFLDPLREVATHSLRNAALVACCFLALCLWYFLLVRIRLGIDTQEASGTVLDIYTRYAQTRGQFVHSKCHEQDDSQQTWENLTNQVRKITFQRIFSLISNFRHRWFFQSMVISIIDERGGAQTQINQGQKSWESFPASLLVSGLKQWQVQRVHSVHMPQAFLGSRRLQVAHPLLKGAQHSLWRTRRRGQVCIPSNDGENNSQTQYDMDLRLWVVCEPGWEKRKVTLCLLKSPLKFVIFSHCKYQQ